MQVKIDLHVHTCYSYDSIITPETLVLFARKHGLDAVAVTDHDRLDGAAKIAKQTGFPIVSGVEVSSSDGHIIGLNVQEQIPPKLGADETVDRIHEASGLAVACHPTALFKGSVGKHASQKFDAVEVVNASAFPFARSAKQGEEIAARLHVARVGGSDAHYGPEIGCAYTIVDAELEAESIVKAINKGMCQPFGRAIPLKLRLKREIALLKKRI